METSPRASLTASLGVQPFNPQNPMLKVAFWITCFYVVSLVGRAPEIMMLSIGTSLYHITILNVILVLFGLTTGVLGRVAFSKIGLAWILFYAWIALTLPFSGYRSGSLSSLLEVAKSLPVMFFTAAFFGLNFDTMRKGIWTFVWSGVLVMAMTATMGVSSADDERLSTESGTFGNANELSMILSVLSPFFALVAASPRYSGITRLAAAGSILYSASIILRTGSRGGLLTMGLLAVVLFLKVSPVKKVVVVASVIVASILALQLLPSKTVVRLKSIFSSQSENADAASAVASANERVALFWESVDATIKHPLFGVGLGVYADVEAGEAQAQGKRGKWMVTHNAYTELSAEVGLLGLGLWLMAVIRCFRSLAFVRKFARDRPELAELDQIAGAVQISLLAFLFFCVVASISYNSMLFALTGTSLALLLATQRLQQQEEQSAPFGVQGLNGDARRPHPHESVFSPQTFQTKGFGRSEAPVHSPNGAAEARRGAKPWQTSGGAAGNRDAPWRRNPRRHPPAPGGPSR